MTTLIDRLIEARDTRQAVVDVSTGAPASQADAYRMQEIHTARLLAKHGGAHIGFKLGATNPAAMKAMGFEAPFAGPLLSPWIYESPATLPHADFFLCVIEAEVAFRFGSDLTSSAITESDLVGAIAEAFPVIEIADSRLAAGQAAGPLAIIADVGLAGALITGTPCANWREIDLAALAVTVTADGTTAASGTGAIVLGSPLNSLAQFARVRAAQGQPLKAGQIISTGTCTPPFPGKSGQQLKADFGAFGSVSLMLT